jgi:hypothetical protein
LAIAVICWSWLFRTSPVGSRVDFGDLQQDLRRRIGADGVGDGIDRAGEGGADAGASENRVIGAARDAALAFDGDAERGVAISASDVPFCACCFSSSAFLASSAFCCSAVQSATPCRELRQRTVALRRDFAHIEPDIAIIADRKRRHIDAGFGLEGGGQQLLLGGNVLDLVAVLVEPVASTASTTTAFSFSCAAISSSVEPELRRSSIWS